MALVAPAVPPSPAAAAATSHAVLRVLLEHPAITGDPALVCRLLACSKAAAEAVAEACAGRLAVAALLRTTGAAESLGRWLARRGDLLRSLEVDVADVDLPRIVVPGGDAAPGFEERSAYRRAVSVVAAAALQWVPSGGLRRLQSLRWLAHYEPLPFLALPRLLGGTGGGAIGLTHLDVGIPPAHRGLAALTGLCSLSFRYFSEQDSVLAPALAGMSLLTRLEFGEGEVGEEVVRQLPTSLRHLAFLCGTECSNGMRLAHLTALTSLVVEVYDTQVAWELPPSLVTFDCCWWGFMPAAPLLGLSNLQTLKICAAPGELVQLRALTSLVHLGVVYQKTYFESAENEEEEEEEGMLPPLSEVLDACRGLPLRSLDIDLSECGSFAQEVPAALPLVPIVLCGLESLALCGGVRCAADPPMLAQLLLALTTLRRCEMQSVCTVGGRVATSEVLEQFVEHVAPALARLPRLECLTISRLGAKGEGAAVLRHPACTALRSRGVCICCD